MESGGSPSFRFPCPPLDHSLSRLLYAANLPLITTDTRNLNNRKLIQKPHSMPYLHLPLLYLPHPISSLAPIIY